ncbi:protein mitoshell [Chironomus tepperi]|uniref:protein mitoshell n=1 Tax=Chironomus tepperi TaxID=113505 RepID=UPI00391F2815
MSYEYPENMAINSNGNVSNRIFQFLGPQFIQSQHAGCPIPIPICALPPPNSLNSQNRPPMYPVHIYHNQNKPYNHFQNRPNMSANNPHNDLPLLRMSRTNQSPIKSPVIPNKRHKFNESQVNDTEPKCDTTSLTSSSSSNEGISGLEVDSIFYELQCFASNGCTFAESVAQSYRKRPCFKKIELLLSRLKQELNIHHNITSNINSQGTAWAIKDFIFVFSRIVNAWIIMRGYIYDKSKGLDDLRKDYDPNFCESFIEWQEATLKMMKALMGTVENFDVLTQNKSGNVNKKKEVYVDKDAETKQYSKEFLEKFQKELFSPKSAENSEEVQIRTHQTNAYFRSGYLKPLQIDSQYSLSSSMEPTTPVTPSSDPLNWMSYEDLNDSPFTSASTASSGRLYNRKSYSLPTTPMDHHVKSFDLSFKSRAKKDLSSKFNSMGGYNRDIEAELEQEFGKLEINIDVNDDENMRLEKMYKKDSSKVIYLINEVSKLSYDDSFTVCINLIVDNIKNGKYSNLNSILDEFKILLKHAKGLIENANDDKTSLKKFVAALEAIINRKAFEKY